MHSLEAILQLNVATDQAAVTHLPFIISILTYDTFQSSSHLPKWIARVNSLLNSKNPGSRWAGLCLALQTGILNKEVLKECSQNWISICLPMLSRNDDIPNMKASIRLLNYIFFQTLSISEFQRQLATPNVPKYSTALLNLVEKTENPELQTFCLESLTRIIQAYPTLHRQLLPNLSSLCFRLLSGKATGSDPEVIALTCNLLSILHITGGKVASTTAWQKTLETSIANAWWAFSSVRVTFPPIELPKMVQNLQPTFKPPSSDPLIAIPLSLDRLKSASCLIIYLLKAPVYRPTGVAIGELVQLTLAFLRCSSQTEEAPFDVQRRALEASIVPQLWDIACKLLSQMATSLKHHLNPSLSRILSSVINNVERVLNKSHKLVFLRSLEAILAHTYSLHSAVLLNRLVKHLLSCLTVILPQKKVTISQTQTSTSKKGKKRTRGFDGDEVFRVGGAIVCADHIDEEILLSSLSALELLLPNPHLSSSLRVLSARLLLNVLFELSRSPTTLLSQNPNFHGTLYNKVMVLCRKELTSGKAGWLNSAFGLVVSAIDRANVVQGDDKILQFLNEFRRDLDMLLHPRLPPLLRSNPPIEALTLFHSERETEDKVNRETIGVEGTQDIEMTPAAPTVTQPKERDQELLVGQGLLKSTIIQAEKEVDSSIPSKVSFPSLTQQTTSIPSTDTQQSFDKIANTAPLQPELQKDNAHLTMKPQNLHATIESTIESLGASAPPRFEEANILQRMPPVGPPDSDNDEMPEINLESESD